MSARPDYRRRDSRPVRVGGLVIGGGAPVVVQSMTKTDTRDAESTLAQIRSLADAGCELVRCAVPDAGAASALAGIVAKSPLPVVADIHFDPDLALMALDAGVAKLRINPGTLGDRSKVRRVAERAAEAGVPIRIGVNAGSLEREFLERDGRSTASGMVDSALRHADIFQSWGFRDIVISLKASDVPRTLEAYRSIAARCDLPLHLGLTEAGFGDGALIKSAVGIGTLLAEGIGDTLRVSLTADPLQEVAAAFSILRSLGLRRRGPEFISCPTCGRCEIDVVAIATEVQRRLQDLKAPLKIAVMGCAVNGPGEAREADIGFAGGRSKGAIFRRGELLYSVEADRAADALVDEARKLAAECNGKT